MTEHRPRPHHRRATDPPGPLDLARWAEDRLHDSVGTAITAARLYGLEVIDAATLLDVSPAGRPAARLTFLAESADAGALVLGPAATDACNFDAAVLAATRWEAAVSPLPRPGEHLVRRRVRVVVLVGESGVATASRFEHDDVHVVVARGLAWGGAAGVQLAATWSRTRGCPESSVRWS